MMNYCSFALKSSTLYVLFSNFFTFFPHRWKFLVFSIYGSCSFSNCKQYVGSGINSLMSIANGLGPSIFCQNMEKANSMREETDARNVYFPPESAF